MSADTITYMPKKQTKGRAGRHPNNLPPESAEEFRLLLEDLYAANECNAARVGELIGTSGQAVTQLRSGATKQVSVSTAEGIARAVGKRLYIGLTGEEPPEGMRTIGSDRASMDALIAAVEQYGIPPWLTAILACSPIPEGWPSVNPQVIHDLAAVWEKWDGKLGSRVMRKAVRKR